MKRVVVRGLNKKGKVESRILRAETVDDFKTIQKIARKLTEVTVLNYE